MGWRCRGFSKWGFTLSGRDALHLYGLTSADNRVVFAESSSTKDLPRGICIAPESDDFRIVDGVKCKIGQGFC